MTMLRYIVQKYYTSKISYFSKSITTQHTTLNKWH